MVTAAVGVAAVMGVAILSSTTLQTTASANGWRAVQADALADGAVNLGLFYLQNLNDSTRCPAALVAGGTSFSVSGVSLGAAVPGTYDLALAKLSTTRWRVTGTGRVPGSEGGSVVRKIVVTTDVNYTIGALTLSAGSGTAVIPSTARIAGNVYAACPVQNDGQVSGVLYGDTVTGSGSAAEVRPATGMEVTAAPTAATVNHYATYAISGRTYAAAAIGSGTLSNVTLSPNSTTNPAGIFTYSGSLQLDGNVKINGTLVVVGGQLKVRGTGNTITPASGYPAAVVDQDLYFNGTGGGLEATGLVWTGGKVTADAGTSSATLRVTGAVMSVGGTGAIAPAVTVNLTHDRAAANVPGLWSAAVKPSPSTVTVVNWKN